MYETEGPLRVALDARTIYSPKRRGTGKNLIDLYRALAFRKPQWEFLMLYQNEISEDPFGGIGNIRRKRIDIQGDRMNLWQDIRLPIAACMAGASVLHCPANSAPLRPLTPTVLTIHDLIPLEIAPNGLESQRWKRRVRRSARRASRILTPSEYSRDAIVKRLGVPAGRITVNYWAPDTGCHASRPDEILKTRALYAIPADMPYIFALGAVDTRKNTAGIMKAWSLLDAETRKKSRLVIVGLQREAMALFQKIADETIPDGTCLLYGFAEEKDMTALLSGASALCYPSLSEGFGLPVLDSFICGTPVITSLTTSLPEVAGDAALLVNPADPKDIANGLNEILTSAETRERLRIAGFRRVVSFSWERCAATVAAVLESAAN